MSADDEPDAEELAYMAGKRRALIDLFHHIANELLGVDAKDPIGLLAIAQVERLEAVAALREVCADYGDNEWEDNLHLADVIEKHLARPLAENEDDEGDAS